MGAADPFAQWAATHRRAAEEGSALLWPSETLVRLMKGTYVPGLDKDYGGKKAIDIGFGSGNNLAFLGSLGLLLHGTEVAEEVCEPIRQRLERIGYKADLRVGTNREIPWPDNEFDVMVSWNVVHYEENEDAIKGALAEYHRVLKPGGRLFLSTTGPEHKILEGSTTLGRHRYLIGREDDFRKGQVFFYFDTPGYVRYYLAERFKEVLVGRTQSFLFTETLDWFVATGVKG